MAHSLVPIASVPPRDRGPGTLRRRTARLAAVAAAAAVTCLSAPAALAAGSVTPARGPIRSALVQAFIAQGGSSRGITGVYVSGSAGIVCQRTPDAGLVRFLFRHANGSWKFAFSSRGTAHGTAIQRRLARACH